MIWYCECRFLGNWFLGFVWFCEWFVGQERNFGEIGVVMLDFREQEQLGFWG